MSISHREAGRLHPDGSPRASSVGLVSQPAPSPATPSLVVLIEPRQFIRDCLARAIQHACNQDVIALGSIDEWLDVCENIKASLILLSGLDRFKHGEICRQARLLSQARRRVPIVILSDDENLNDIGGAPDFNVAGFIPTDMSLNLAAQALRLIRAGVVFVPSSPKAGKHSSKTLEPRDPLRVLFTARQAEVVEALRQGKANKTIAYELQLQESTVKVHVRNIMKKLRAKNRTEVAYIVSNHQNRTYNRMQVIP